MPFGRYAGRPLDALPDDYLEWLATLGNLREPLRTRVERESRRRLGCAEAATPSLPLAPEIRLAAECIVSRGYRALATEHHPDAGGDHERMVALNVAHEALVGLLRGAA